MNIPNAQHLHVYAGSRKKEISLDLVQSYIIDITRHVLARTTTKNYRASATQMCAAVDCVGKLLSQDGAMRMAVSLAAELSSVMYINPYLEVNEQTFQYDSDLVGAWTFGGGLMPDSELTTRDAWEGTETERSARLTSMFHGFNFSALSLCTVDLYDTSAKGTKNYLASVVARERSFLSALNMGYRVHVVTSYYRVLIGMNMMETEEFGYVILNIPGLRSTITMQAIALTLSLGRMLSFNGFGLRMWTGFDMRSHFHAAYPFSGIIGDLTYNSILHVDPMTLASIADAGGDVAVYYGSSSWEDDTWGHTLPIPFWMISAWNVHFDTTLSRPFNQRYESVSRILQRYFTCVEQNTISGQHLASGTLDFKSCHPITLITIGSLFLTYLPLPIEQWSWLSSRAWAHIANFVHSSPCFYCYFCE